jgi:hypothetical protein
MARFVEKRPVESVFIAFIACVLIALSVGIAHWVGAYEKRQLDMVALAAWELAINLWFIGVVITGEVHRGKAGGPVLASRERSPVKFWCIVCSLFVLFNAVGLFGMLNHIVGTSHGQ